MAEAKAGFKGFINILLKILTLKILRKAKEKMDNLPKEEQPPSPPPPPPPPPTN